VRKVEEEKVYSDMLERHFGLLFRGSPRDDLRPRSLRAVCTADSRKPLNVDTGYLADELLQGILPYVSGPEMPLLRSTFTLWLGFSR
jgi:hypothetical protein